MLPRQLTTLKSGIKIYPSCIMVKLGYHSILEFYAHGIPDQKVLGMKDFENHR